MPVFEPFLTAGPWALVAVGLIYAVPRLIVALVALFRVPPDKLPAVLRALAELFRFRR
ncbi:hypothetical protein ONA91_04450 [Micromonospora sp. DR5-3]|uniref:hypothetical protein n=1 Tax=unclassified Micromonospora TaxID=2617518 RepID=UPI001651F0C2|nr:MULTISPECIES: hypothetical protein [unclassified Micromonospora]MCW3813709.1 hypothetical protein [Micromonospora sp. DR5-3]